MKKTNLLKTMTLGLIGLFLLTIVPSAWALQKSISSNNIEEQSKEQSQVDDKDQKQDNMDVDDKKDIDDKNDKIDNYVRLTKKDGKILNKEYKGTILEKEDKDKIDILLAGAEVAVGATISVAGADYHLNKNYVNVEDGTLKLDDLYTAAADQKLGKMLVHIIEQNLKNGELVLADYARQFSLAISLAKSNENVGKMLKLVAGKFNMTTKAFITMINGFLNGKDTVNEINNKGITAKFSGLTLNEITQSMLAVIISA